MFNNQWFLFDDLSTKLSEKNGQNEVKYSINYFYSKKEYFKVVDLCLQVLSLDNGKHVMRDMYESLIRSYLKLDNVSKAAEYVDPLINVNRK